MKNYAPESIIVLILSLGIVVFLLALTLKSVFTEVPMSIEKSKILDSMMTSIIAIISMYIGSKLNNKKP